jgi:hypothetical protein
MSRVTFETKCWQGDFETILAPGYLAEAIKRHIYKFHRRVLFINNVESHSRELVRDMAFERVADGTIDCFYFVDEYIEDALIWFKLNKESLGKGYMYSSAEIVAVRRLESVADFIVHYSSDSALAIEYDWISQALDIFKKEPKVFVVNPCWNGRVWEAAYESIADRASYYLGHGFSDQCYMMKIQEVLRADLNLRHPCSERYPKYGGELFEKRIDSYMRCNGLLRATLKHISYVHPAF